MQSQTSLFGLKNANHLKCNFSYCVIKCTWMLCVKIVKMTRSREVYSHNMTWVGLTVSYTNSP